MSEESGVPATEFPSSRFSLSQRKYIYALVATLLPLVGLAGFVITPEAGTAILGFVTAALGLGGGLLAKANLSE